MSYNYHSKRKSKVIDSRVTSACIEEENESRETKDEAREAREASEGKMETMSLAVRANSEEHFGSMRPTSWSPPPVKADSTQKQSQRNSNVCKITVAPSVTPTSFMVHRLQVKLLFILVDSYEFRIFNSILFVPDVRIISGQ
jgi:hypothetical protein